MKTLILFTSTFLLSLSFLAQKTLNKNSYFTYDTTFNDDGLPVSSAVKNAYSQLIDSSFFDKEGNKNKQVEYIVSKDNKYKRVYNYKNNNEIEIFLYYPNGILYEKYNCKYNKYGKLTEKIDYDSLKNFEFKTIYEYNNYGNKVLEIKQSSIGEIIDSIFFSYDNNGFCIDCGDNRSIQKLAPNISELKNIKDNRGFYIFNGSYNKNPYFRYDTILNSFGTNIFTTIKNAYSQLIDSSYYNKEGDKIKQVEYLLFKSNNAKLVYEYKKNNEIDISLFFSKNKLVEKSTFKYNEYGKVIEKTDNDSLENFELKTIYEYDNYGNKTSEEEYNIRNERTSGSYDDYDENGFKTGGHGFKRRGNGFAGSQSTVRGRSDISRYQLNENRAQAIFYKRFK